MLRAPCGRTIEPQRGAEFAEGRFVNRPLLKSLVFGLLNVAFWDEGQSKNRTSPPGQSAHYDWTLPTAPPPSSSMPIDGIGRFLSAQPCKASVFIMLLNSSLSWSASTSKT